MLNSSARVKVRHLIKKIPLSEELYHFLTTVFSPTYSEDGMRLYKNCDFMNQPDFKNAYALALKQQPGTKMRWRAHVTQWAGFHAAKLDGDFVETGVNRAFLSTSVMSYVNFQALTNRKFYLFDTFEGLVPELVGPDEKAAFKNEYSCTYDFVSEAFKDYHNVIVVKGIVPDSLSAVEIHKVAYLSVDMNCAMPERAALEYFWPKIVPGGIIILDDYAWPGRQPQKKSADEFAASVDVRVLSLPTGQGVILKPIC
jgi:O-methyltransferase